MARKRRQRGKRHSSKKTEDVDVSEDEFEQTEEPKLGQINKYTKEPIQPFLGVLTPEEEKYFREIEETLVSHNTRDNEDTRYLVDSIFAEVSGKELQVLNNVFGSKVLEKVFTLASSQQIKNFFGALNGSYLQITQTTFGSFVLEKLLSHMGRIIDMEEKGGALDEEEGSEFVATAESLIMYMCNELRPEISALLDHKLAAHVLEKLLLLLNGQRSVQEGESKAKYVSISVPSSFKEYAYSIVESAAENLEATELRAYSVNKYASRVIQAFVRIEFERRARSKKNKATPFSDKLLLSKEYDWKELPFVETLLKDETGSRVLEVLVERMPASDLTRLENVFEGRYYRLCVHPIANFVMQKFIKRANALTVERMLNELKDSSESLVRKSFLSVLKTLLETCNEKNFHQNHLFRLIISAAKERHPKQNLFVALLRSKHKKDKNSTDGKRVLVNNFIAVQLVEEMLRVPIELSSELIESLLELEPESIVEYATETASSHIIEQILGMSDLKMAHRRRLLNAFDGHFAEIAVTAPGSHIVDKCWFATQDLPLYRSRIVAELAEAGDEVKFDFYGKKVWANWKVELYRRAADQWYRWSKEDKSEKPIMKRVRSLPPLENTFARKRTMEPSEDLGASKKTRMTAFFGTI
ncbi:RNA-binding protein Nop9 [Schizosaccharomyces japonicus yFS275]|uniref:Nucleolar protein 9 n=1 Tax=Schizosaccharomyces japonicus (strain yFS275 / FY16936) TaxID=402676 RepID=NOP9_SCHJY|nr:RNA-binding protein Nop9 [Schizosaccharomyces japonicus yFS275]B6K1Y8.1 RecName: Full=Nucleolar protein 9; AltName: Full=Pumilio domain-containing protein nop9 [Schizosaccharomyces japonicus yFS275]EEB07169.1 RNA-binding protein Nop9 [Schizosaccharomyces japonicus yFS275]